MRLEVSQHYDWALVFEWYVLSCRCTWFGTTTAVSVPFTILRKEGKGLTWNFPDRLVSIKNHNGINWRGASHVRDVFPANLSMCNQSQHLEIFASKLLSAFIIALSVMPWQLKDCWTAQFEISCLSCQVFFFYSYESSQTKETNIERKRKI